MSGDSRRLPRWWVPVALAGVAAVVTLTVLALQTPEYDPATPQGTAQRWVRAMVDGDHVAALAELDPGLGCTLADLRYSWAGPEETVRIGSVSGDAENTIVEIIVGRADPITGGYEYTEYLVMAQRGDRWVLIEVPWPVYGCRVEVQD